MKNDLHKSEDSKILDFPTPQKQLNDKRKKHNFILLCLAALFVIAVIALANFTNSNSGGKSNNSLVDNFDSDNYAFASYKDGYIYAKDGKISCYNSNRELLWEKDGKKSKPSIEVCEKYVLVYYKSNDIAIVTNGSKIREINADGNVIYGSVNKNGYCALIVEEKGFKNEIAVYDKDGNSVYKWHNSDEYITSVKLSDNNNYIVTGAVGFSQDSVNAKALIFNTKSEKDCKKITFKNSIICDIKFINKNDFVVVLDNSAYCYTANKKNKWKIDYHDKKLCTYDIGNSGNIALVFGDDSIMNSSDVVYYNSRGREKGKYKSEAKVLRVDVQGNSSLLTGDRQISIVNTRGKKIFNQKLSYDVKNCFFLGTKKAALIESGAGAFIVPAN